MSASERVSSARKTKLCQLVVHDDGLVVDLGFPIQPRLVPGRPDAAEDERHELVAIAEGGREDEQEIDARVRVEEEAADVVHAEDPRRKAVLVLLEAVDQLVDGGCLVDVEEVGRQVADEEGHDDGEEDGGKSTVLLRA